MGSHGSQDNVSIKPHVTSPNVASKRKKRIVRKLAIGEVLIGITCLVIGVAVVVIAKSAGSEEYRTIGEGIWAPVVAILAGAFGVLAGGQTSSGSKVNAHLGTGIIAALFAFVLTCIDSDYSMSSKGAASDVYNYGVTILACLSFLNMILLIISTTYACCMIEGCICCCDIERRDLTETITFTQGEKRRNPVTGAGKRHFINTQPKSSKNHH